MAAAGEIHRPQLEQENHGSRGKGRCLSPPQHSETHTRTHTQPASQRIFAPLPGGKGGFSPGTLCLEQKQEVAKAPERVGLGSQNVQSVPRHIGLKQK